MNDSSAASIPSWRAGDRAFWRIADRGGYRASEGGFDRWTAVVVEKVGPKRIKIRGAKKNGAGVFEPAFRWTLPTNLRPRQNSYRELGESGDTTPEGMVH